MFQRHGSSSFTILAASAFALACWPSSSWAQDLCFQNAASIGSGLPLSSSASGDLDGDGDQDIAVTHSSASSPGFYVVLNHGNGTFATPVFYPGFLVPMAIVDLNGDGANDVVGVGTGATIVVRLNQGSGILAAASSYPSGNPSARLVTGDLDGDGDLDVATANSTTLTHSVLLNQGTGAFGAPVVYSAAPGTTGNNRYLFDFDLKDVDGDGDLDLVGAVTDLDTGSSHFGDISHRTLRRNIGNGTLGAAELSSFSGVPRAIAMDDFDGDGDPDLAIADEYPARIVLFVNPGNGVFVQSAAYVTQLAVWMESGDIDSDGDPDLVVSVTDPFFTSSGMQALTNNGSGVFATSSFAIGSMSGYWMVSDLFGDSRPEVFAPNSSSNGYGLTVARNCQTVGSFRYCFGDGFSAVPCPCQNYGNPERGCANVLYLEGAQLSATGNSSVSDDTLVLNSIAMSGAQSWYFQATGQDALPFGRGILCVAGTLLRVGQKSVVGGNSSNPSGTDLPLSVKGAIPPTGGTRYYQVSYRQANPVCTPTPTSNTNRTNGLAIVWTP